MKVKISDKIYITNPTNDILLWCDYNLILINPTWQTLTKLGKAETIRRTHVPQKIKCYVKNGDTIAIPYGCLYGIWKYIKDAEIDLEFNNHPNISISNLSCPVELYDYQEEAVDSMINAKGGILTAGCGAGKTFMGIEILRRIGKRFLWLTHTSDLLRQTLREMKSLYPKLDVGLITEGEVKIGKDGAIATVQTLSKIDYKVYSKEFDVVMVDECHRAVGTPTNVKMFSKVIENIPARYKYGLTATPKRSDTMIKSIYMLLGLSKDGQFEPTFKVDRNKVKTMVATHVMIPLYTDIDYNSDVFGTDGTINYNNLINYFSYNKERNEEIIKNIIKCGQEDRKQVVLCHRIDHCKILNEMLLQKGLNSTLIIGATKAKDRENILKQNIKWDILVATYSLLKEGVNVKELDTLHLTTPQKDKSMIVQCVGRIERFLEGKKQPIAYDYVDVKYSYCTKAYDSRRKDIKRRF